VDLLYIYLFISVGTPSRSKIFYFTSSIFLTNTPFLVLSWSW